MILLTSLKKSTEVFVLPPSVDLPPNPPQWGNYKTVFDEIPHPSPLAILPQQRDSRDRFQRLRHAALLLRWRPTPSPGCAFPAGTSSFVMLLSTLMLPATVTIVPRFIVFEQLGWL